MYMYVLMHTLTHTYAFAGTSSIHAHIPRPSFDIIRTHFCRQQGQRYTRHYERSLHRKSHPHESLCDWSSSHVVAFCEPDYCTVSMQTD